MQKDKNLVEVQIKFKTTPGRLWKDAEWSLGRKCQPTANTKLICNLIKILEKNVENNIK